MFKFTDSQQLALDFPGNVIVSAGAGSGKTRILVEKYFRLLVDEHPTWPVDSVVAITFTRKAAAELKFRIIRRIHDELDVETETGPRRDRLRQLRNDVGAAPIGTIHNFCGRILREFAFDAHLNPDFAVIEGAQESALRLKAARSAIASATSDSGSDIYRDLLTLLTNMSATALENTLATMLGGRTAFVGPAQNYLAKSVDELFDDLQEFHREYTEEPRREMAQEWARMLEALREKCAPGKVYDAAVTILEQLPADVVGEWARCSELLTMAKDALLTKTGTCRKVEFRKAGIEEFDEIRDNLEKLGARFSKACLDDLNDGDREDLELSRRLARLFLSALEDYERLRGGTESDGEVQLVDFSDLEILTEKLVHSGSRVRDMLRQRYKFLILDEFQDTSEQQWRILKPLCTDESGEILPESLFVVGDRKQGVYGFREANVTLFTEAQELIAAGNEEWSGSRGMVSMTENFRTTEKPLVLVNRVFQGLLDASGNRFGVEFEALTPTRKEPCGEVEFILASDPEPEDEEAPKQLAADRTQDEAELVASHIRRQIDSGVKPGDIAILFRKRSIFGVYSEALERRGIPVVSQQGLNLFQQAELLDMNAALNAVVHPQKDLVLVHFLRSPFIGFTDNLLLKVSRCPGRSFWDKANRVLADGRCRLDNEWYDLDADSLERLAFAFKVLRDTRSLVDCVPPYEVVRYLLDKLGASVIVRAGYRGEQAAANLDKLLATARSAEFLSYEEFLEYIANESASDRGTVEAADLKSVDAVRIMTIHAAKGLEFPVVYLADLNSGTGGRPSNVSGDSENWMTLRPGKDNRPEPSFLMTYFLQLDQHKAAAEERRVFYVAMTRCRDKLVLSANEDKRSKDTFYSWIEEEFDGSFPVFTRDSFSDDELEYEAEVVETGSYKKVSRKARIEAGLRAADWLFKKPASVSPPDSAAAYPVDILMRLIKEFVAAVRRGSVDDAVRRVLPRLRAVVTGGENWEPAFQSFGAWVQENFPVDNLLVMDPVLRVQRGSEIELFYPLIRSDDRCAWVILPGGVGEEVRGEVERYRSGSGDLDALVFEFSQSVLPGAAS